MTMWIVAEGEASPLDFATIPPRDRYGYDWIVVESADADDAQAQAEAWDASRGSMVEMEMFAVGYRAGAFGLPGDALVGMTEIAERAGTTAGTVRAWRNRNLDFPEPAQDLAIGPVWHWSDVARWLAVPRPTGRPRKG